MTFIVHHIFEHNINLNDVELEYIERKLSVAAPYVGDKEYVCDVEVERSQHHQKGDVFRAEVMLSFDGDVYRAEAQGGSLQESIDTVKDILRGQLSEAKDKKITTRRA